MPGTMMERLPLPNLKLYTGGSAVALGAAVYHAVAATSAPGWRARPNSSAGPAAPESRMLPLPPGPAAAAAPATRDISDHFLDVVTYMMQEPLCMWSVLNMGYCAVAVAGAGVRRAVFGPLRGAEAQRLKDRFWNYVFYKFIFVFGVINVQYMDEVVAWCAWFTLVGFLHLLAHLCKDRFEYVTSTGREAGEGGAGCVGRVVWLVWGVSGAAAALLPLAAAVALPHAPHTFAFMAAECVLVMCSALHVCARHVLQQCDADGVGPLAYYTHLAFDSISLAVEALHVGHMVMVSRAVVSLPALVLVLQLRHLLHRLHRRLRRHRLYTALAHHMTTHYPMASREEVAKHEDKCAICWEPMKEARKLPCAHLFHNSCLWQWVQQDASCPTCRRALSAPRPAGRALPAQEPPPPGEHHPLPIPTDAPTNHLFRFDGSRYVSWLPSLSVEVSRGGGRVPPGGFPRGAAAAVPPPQSPPAPYGAVSPRGLAGSSPRLSAHATTPIPELPAMQDQWSGSDEPIDVVEGFPAEASARENALQLRKRMLLQAARHKYLQRTLTRASQNHHTHS